MTTLANFTKAAVQNLSAMYFVAAATFGSGAIYTLLERKSHPELYWWQSCLLAGAAILVAAFPVSWIVRPIWHPVRRALAAHGDPDKVAEMLDVEMNCPHEVLGPFHFTRNFLVYSSSYTVDVVPYDVIESALWQLDPSGEPPATPEVVVMARDGRTYEWHRTWIEGRFDAAQVLESIRTRAKLTSKIGIAYYKLRSNPSLENP